MSSYLDRVRHGEQIEVTDRGRPVAMLIPLPEDRRELAELIADEAESEALDQWLGEQVEPHLVSTVPARTEVRRAVQ